MLLGVIPMFFFWDFGDLWRKSQKGGKLKYGHYQAPTCNAPKIPWNIMIKIIIYSRYKLSHLGYFRELLKEN